MITDERRRVVAKRMREYDVSEFKESAIVPFLECLGYGYMDWRVILDELADLIDPPTPAYICEKCGGEWPADIKFENCPYCGTVVDDAGN